MERRLSMDQELSLVAVDEAIPSTRLRALALKATPGPWDWCPSDKDAGPGYRFGGQGALDEMGYAYGAEDAAYIAAVSPDVVLALLAELDEARRDRGRLALEAATADADWKRAGAELADTREALRLAVDILDDVWGQFSYDGKTGGLSTLEWVYDELPKLRAVLERWVGQEAPARQRADT